VRIVICWSQISGYMAACWRAMVKRCPDIQIVAFKSGQHGTNAAFADEVIQGLPIQLLDADERANQALIESRVIEHRPDVVIVPGWLHQPYMHLLHHPSLSSARFIMGMDTPWKGTWRQRMARLKLGWYLERADRVVVAGERSWQYATFLHVPEGKLRRGVYGIDYQNLSGLYDRRLQLPGGWGRNFLYSGRYTHVKGIDVLVDAYMRYRRNVSNPWSMVCCGQGELSYLLTAREGITNHGFVQPWQTGDLYTTSGVFVMASRYDPWPLALVEGCAAGLPILCTESCGSAVELVRSHYNGITVGTEDAGYLAWGMQWMHEHRDQLPQMGARSRGFAAPYSAELWAQRWLDMCQEVVSLYGSASHTDSSPSVPSPISVSV